MLKSWLAKLPRPVFKWGAALQALRYSLSRENSYDIMRLFGLFGFLHNPFVYIIALNQKGVSLVETRLRIVNLFLFIPLIFINYWPSCLHRLKKYYWFFTVTFVLPFFATVMFILNNGSQAWVTKITFALLWMVLVTNWTMFFLCLVIGMMSGIIYYGVTIDSSFAGFTLSWPELANSFWMVVIAGLFSLKREEMVRNRVASMRSLAGAIAHEMRTPLFGIRSASVYLSQRLPAIMAKYIQSQGEKLSEKEQLSVERILKTPERIDEITRSAFSIIDMLLTNLKGVTGAIALERQSMHSIIQTALEHYPLSTKEKSIIHFKQEEDAYIQGNKDLLVQVMYNLIKNALYYIKEAGKGEIFIWLEDHKDFVVLNFQDTGKGISEKSLPFIFDPYYSNTKYGTGVGLHFCKQVIEACGGSMVCSSKENVQTTFKIELRKYDDSEGNNQNKQQIANDVWLF
ncbi:sensor histidine kinase [Candidatus Odyssella thessalonicensis]|uniref:sensor histidine kinase n=1 Tax=Candidatus Odyssella thessalonicensis TaxID=84647 RepID=UPI0002D9AE0C|nr:HAMP domain-containing sensor histidine kinase [Candidatus Odyssella thessalonicensis]